MQKQIILSAAFLLLGSTAAHANTVEMISARQARIGEAPIINVCPKTGYSLVFYNMGDSIPRAWNRKGTDRIEVSFDTREIGEENPAGLIKFETREGAELTGSSILTLSTTNKRVMRFRIAHNCPSNVDTGYVVADDKDLDKQLNAGNFGIAPAQKKDPVIPKPKAKVAQVESDEELELPTLNFSNLVTVDPHQYYFEPEEEEGVGEIPPAPLYHAEEPPAPEEDWIIRAPIEIPVPELPPVKTAEVETVAVSPAVEQAVSKAELLGYLRKGVSKAVIEGHMGYRSGAYMKRQSLIRRVARFYDGETYTLNDAVNDTWGIDHKDAANLLALGGMK